MRYQVASDVAGQNSSVSFILQGDSGTGKSRAGALMPKPAIILFEKQGLRTIQAWSPEAIVFPTYQDDPDGTFTGIPDGPIEDPKIRTEMVDVFIESIRNGKPQPGGGIRLAVPILERRSRKVSRWEFPEDAPVILSVVLDSATEWQRIKLEAILGRKVGEVSEEEIAGKDWGSLKDGTISLFRRLRDLPVHSMILGLSEDKETRGGLKAMPAFYGKKVGPAVAQFVNAVGWMVKLSDGAGVRFAVVFEGASDVAITKGCSGLGAIEQLPRDPSEGGPAVWIQRVLSAQPGKAVKAAATLPREGSEGAPAPSVEGGPEVAKEEAGESKAAPDVSAPSLAAPEAGSGRRVRLSDVVPGRTLPGKGEAKPIDREAAVAAVRAKPKNEDGKAEGETGGRRSRAARK